MGVVMFTNGWSSVDFTNPFNRVRPSFAVNPAQAGKKRELGEETRCRAHVPKVWYFAAFMPW
jgi:hypothetical protein